MPADKILDLAQELYGRENYMREVASASRYVYRSRTINRRFHVNNSPIWSRTIAIALRIHGNRLCKTCRGFLPLETLRRNGEISEPVLTDHVAALSCGIYEGLPVADLDYAEDSVADTDGNFVITGSGNIVEIQATAEGAAFSEEEFASIMGLAKTGISELVELQKATIATY